MKTSRLVFVLIFLFLISTAVNAQLSRTFEESSNTIKWSADWRTEASPLASGGSWKVANELNAELSFNFEGNAVSLIYAKGPDAATALIEIDGIKAAEINASSDTYMGRVRHIVAQNLEQGKHVLKLKIVSAGEKNGFAVDAFEVQTFEASGESTSWVVLFLVAIALIIIGIVLYRFYLRSLKKIEAPKPGKKPETPKTAVAQITRMEDMMRTMDEKDRAIIKYLIENNGKAKQSQIKHYLQMPRSTLSKRIAVLEQRNIVETKEVGKTNIVKLTAWFISGKEKGQS